MQAPYFHLNIVLTRLENSLAAFLAVLGRFPHVFRPNMAAFVECEMYFGDFGLQLCGTYGTIFMHILPSQEEWRIPNVWNIGSRLFVGPPVLALLESLAMFLSGGEEPETKWHGQSIDARLKSSPYPQVILGSGSSVPSSVEGRGLLSIRSST